MLVRVACVLVGSGYLHALNLVSLVRVSWFVPCWCALVGVLVGVLVGSDYLHALNLVSLLVCPWLKWLPACLEPRVPGSCVLGWCVPGSCWLVCLAGWCGYLHALNLVSLVRAGSCALLVRVACVLVGSGYLHALNLVSLLVRVLVGSGYLHALNLVSLVRAGWCPGWKWLPTCLEPRVLGWCVLVGVVTCMP